MQSLVEGPATLHLVLHKLLILYRLLAQVPGLALALKLKELTQVVLESLLVQGLLMVTKQAPELVLELRVMAELLAQWLAVKVELKGDFQQLEFEHCLEMREQLLLVM